MWGSGGWSSIPFFVGSRRGCAFSARSRLVPDREALRFGDTGAFMSGRAFFRGPVGASKDKNIASSQKKDEESLVDLARILLQDTAMGLGQCGRLQIRRETDPAEIDRRYVPVHTPLSKQQGPLVATPTPMMVCLRSGGHQSVSLGMLIATTAP